MSSTLRSREVRYVLYRLKLHTINVNNRRRGEEKCSRCFVISVLDHDTIRPFRRRVRAGEFSPNLMLQSKEHTRTQKPVRKKEGVTILTK